MAPGTGKLLMSSNRKMVKCSSKPRYSGFVDTNLDSYLRAKDIRYLFLTGITTNVCVESTGRDAFFAEYWPILIEDAVNHTGPEYCADATLWNFENIFGWVTHSKNVLASLKGHPVTLNKILNFSIHIALVTKGDIYVNSLS